MTAPAGERSVGTDLASRGRTTVADRVVEKIATRAAAEVNQVTGPGRWLDRPLGRGPERPVQATVMVDGDVTTVQLELAVEWPAPVREIGEQVRTSVGDRVSSLTGLTVAEVDIEVTSLPRSVGSGRRVV